MGRETDTGRWKAGDDAGTPWNLLPYLADGPGLGRLLSPVWTPAPSTGIRSFYMPSYGANDLAHASNAAELDAYVIFVQADLEDYPAIELYEKAKKAKKARAKK